MKYFSLIALLVLTIACKKEEASRTTFLVIGEKPFMSIDTMMLRGVVITHPGKIEIRDHGFRIMQDGFKPRMAAGFKLAAAGGPLNFTDTTISLGHRTSIGKFDHKLYPLPLTSTPVQYRCYAYVTDQFGHTFTSKMDSVTVVGP